LTDNEDKSQSPKKRAYTKKKEPVIKKPKATIDSKEDTDTDISDLVAISDDIKQKADLAKLLVPTTQLSSSASQWKVLHSSGFGKYLCEINACVRNDDSPALFFCLKFIILKLGKSVRYGSGLYIPVAGISQLLRVLNCIKGYIKKIPDFLVYKADQSEDGFESKFSITLDCVTSVVHISVRAFENKGPVLFLNQIREEKNTRYGKKFAADTRQIEFDIRQDFNDLLKNVNEHEEKRKINNWE